VNDQFADIRQAFFNLPCGVVVASTSTRGEILQATAQFTAITGYAHEDVPTVGDWLQRAYPDPEYRAMVMSNWERDVSQPGRDVFYRVRCADGSDKELLLRAGLLDAGQMVVALLDLSEIRQVQRELREVKDRF
jgi:PAS domain-containing protein